MAMGKTFKTHGSYHVEPTLGNFGDERKSVFFLLACPSLNLLQCFCEKVSPTTISTPILGPWGGVLGFTFLMLFGDLDRLGPKWVPDLPPELLGPPEASTLEPTCHDLGSHWDRKSMKK